MLLGLPTETSDSIEHILNVKIAEATKKHLESEGKKVVLYDDPSLSNNAEIRQVYTRANDECLSIHNNAGLQVGKMACKARGPVALYYPGRNKGKDLGQIIVNKLLALKGPDNRAEHIHTSTVGVLRNAKADMPALIKCRWNLGWLLIERR